MDQAGGNTRRITRMIAVTGLGIALFVVLSLCLRVPVFENYYLCLGYFAMAVYCDQEGPLSGTIVGAAGVILYCVLINGLRGMPGWAAGNVVIGLALGYWFRFLRGKKQTPVWIVLTAIVIVAAVAAGILGVKSLVEHFLYAQPFLVRAGKNFYAFVADVVVLWAAIPLCALVRRGMGREKA